MQYLLTQEEYDGLIEGQKQLISLTKNQLQKLCTEIAENMPVTREGAYKGDIWGCIITKTPNSIAKAWGYCDDCPAHSICPYDRKRHSK